MQGYMKPETYHSVSLFLIIFDSFEAVIKVVVEEMRTKLHALVFHMLIASVHRVLITLP